VTGVARDDLDDLGASLYAETVRAIQERNPGTAVELLIPDFAARSTLLASIFKARPEVLAHNIETVPRLFREIRPGFRYERSISVITQAHAAGLVTKSNLILGIGERPEEVSSAMRDLRSGGCDLLTITQYLRPSPRHRPVSRWGRPEEFIELRKEAEGLGFAGVMSGLSCVRHTARERFSARARESRNETIGRHHRPRNLGSAPRERAAAAHTLLERPIARGDGPLAVDSPPMTVGAPAANHAGDTIGVAAIRSAFPLSHASVSAGT
jgi:lipoic acid synthetase